MPSHFQGKAGKNPGEAVKVAITFQKNKFFTERPGTFKLELNLCWSKINVFAGGGGMVFRAFRALQFLDLGSTFFSES